MNIGYAAPADSQIKTYSQLDKYSGYRGISAIKDLHAQNGVNLTVPRGSTRLDFTQK